LFSIISYHEVENRFYKNREALNIHVVAIVLLFIIASITVISFIVFRDGIASRVNQLILASDVLVRKERAEFWKSDVTTDIDKKVKVLVFRDSQAMDVYRALKLDKDIS
jgi:hypothetical protein